MGFEVETAELTDALVVHTSVRLSEVILALDACKGRGQSQAIRHDTSRRPFHHEAALRDGSIEFIEQRQGKPSIITANGLFDVLNATQFFGERIGRHGRIAC